MSGVAWDSGTVPPATPPPVAPAPDRVTLTVTDPADGSTVLLVRLVDEIEISRDLSDVSGRFRLRVLDLARAVAAGFYVGSGAQNAVMLAAGMNAALSLDGTLVLKGRIDALHLSGDGSSDSMSIEGRDATCALADCAAAAQGPTEFRGQTLAQIAQAVCAPFGIGVNVEADAGAPFTVAAVRQADTALAFLDSLAKQRAVLLASDGVGNLLITTGGATEAPAPIVLGQNVMRYQCRRDWSRRFSDYFVRGQTNAAGYAPATAAMTYISDVGMVPTDPGYAQPTTQMLGHATDPTIAPWRPTVRLTRTQSGMSSVQDQAEWALRVAQGESDQLTYTVAGWHAGAEAALWMPNALVLVQDPNFGLNQDMLIAGVTWRWSNNDGATTELRVVGVTAYDLTNQVARRRPAGRQGLSASLNAAYGQLQAP